MSIKVKVIQRSGPSLSCQTSLWLLKQTSIMCMNVSDQKLPMLICIDTTKFHVFSYDR